MSLAKASINEASSMQSQRLFRTVTALGAELRRQGVLEPADGALDLIDLAYVALAAANGQAKDARRGLSDVRNNSYGTVLKAMTNNEQGNQS